MSNSSASSGSGSASALVLAFLAGGATAVALATTYLELGETWFGPRKKMKKAVPSILEAYLKDKDPGIGEEVPSTPRKDGYRMPAEWEPHSGCVCVGGKSGVCVDWGLSGLWIDSAANHVRDSCWLLFPHRLDNWRQGAGPAQKAYAHVANAIQTHGNEQVRG